MARVSLPHLKNSKNQPWLLWQRGKLTHSVWPKQVWYALSNRAQSIPHRSADAIFGWIAGPTRIQPPGYHGSLPNPRLPSVDAVHHVASIQPANRIKKTTTSSDMTRFISIELTRANCVFKFEVSKKYRCKVYLRKWNIVSVTYYLSTAQRSWQNQWYESLFVSNGYFRSQRYQKIKHFLKFIILTTSNIRWTDRFESKSLQDVVLHNPFIHSWKTFSRLNNLHGLKEAPWTAYTEKLLLVTFC
jgi:hypothetical protein